ncbi:uncharacterized protein LOC116290872, partial [Actinia tenebrosa]|uniref:Uncharacterized protein LOC116290872 n=1 Tax=Actinia tenebrosa TaxID=6105 RepID=A0A6P8HFV0_ACTTE
MYPWCSFVFVILLHTAVENKGSPPTWPYGTYTLLKPRTGCPAGWDNKGYIYQDTIDKNPSNNRSQTLHIDGKVARSHVKRHFCSKTNKKGKVWPSGQYCVYRHENEKLHRMRPGSILMYDKKNNNKDEYKLTKFRVYIKKTRRSFIYMKLYFACQTSGDKKIPISLPITKPFYLLPYGSRDCQQCRYAGWVRCDGGDTEGVVDRSVMNPTYERGAVLLNAPNETAATLYIGDDSSMHQALSHNAECTKINDATASLNLKKIESKKSGSVEGSDHNPLYLVSEVCETKKISCPSQSEPRESEAVNDSGPNPLYHVLERPDTNSGMPEDQPTSESRESESDKDSGPNPLYHLLEGPDPNNYQQCLISGCNYTLTDKKGVFQSPGFPGEYPDGQLCSWRIIVPVDHTVQVRFAHLSLNENDTLTYSKTVNGSFRSWYTIPLSSTVPFTLSGERDVLFVFRSDESKTSSGFRAEYRVSIPQALTTPTEIPTMSTDTTTIVSTTSWSAPGDSTQWPGGEYVLIKPKNGCPTKWKDKAWILQDTKSKGSNYRSRILHIDGYVASYYVVRSFCIRTGTEVSSVWPQGQYCIYGNKTFSSGSIKMTGEHTDNKDAVKYTSSFVDYYNENSNRQKKHIEFYFQCYTSGNKKIPISLPITKPFYLLPYGSRDCQQVKWMVATKEWIKYRTENAMKGTVPAYQLGNNNGI